VANSLRFLKFTVEFMYEPEIPLLGGEGPGLNSQHWGERKEGRRGRRRKKEEEEEGEEKEEEKEEEGRKEGKKEGTEEGNKGGREERRNRGRDVHKDVYMNLTAGLFIIAKVETPQMLRSRVDKENVAYPYNGISVDNKKKDACHKIDNFESMMLAERKQAQKTPLHGSVHTKYPHKQILEIESRLMVA
jgi:hypothetical protein